LKKYSNLSHGLADYYKKSAINQYLVEKYCTGSKYADKHDELIGKALGRDKYKPDIEKRRFLAMIEGSLPKHIIEAMEQIEAQEFNLTNRNDEASKRNALAKRTSVRWADDRAKNNKSRQNTVNTE
jgi:hypothetical protein